MCDGQFSKSLRYGHKPCGLDDGEYKVHLDELDLSQVDDKDLPQITYKFHTTSTDKSDGGSVENPKVMSREQRTEALDGTYQRMREERGINWSERDSDDYIYEKMFNHSLSEGLGFSSGELEKYLMRPEKHSYFIKGKGQAYSQVRDGFDNAGQYFKETDRMKYNKTSGEWERKSRMDKGYKLESTSKRRRKLI